MPKDWEDPDKRAVKMTESLRVLQDTRKARAAQEVEDEFRQMATAQGEKKKAKAWEEGVVDEEEMLEEQLGIRRERSQCLLLQSQIFIMKEIYETLDKYNDGILRRNEYIMALRTDERIVEFIDTDAVKLAGSKRGLTLEEVLVEVEKDEMYGQMGVGKGQINHKEFVTWREFMSYFNDYREVEERNRKGKEIQKTRENIQRERKGEQEEEGVEIVSLMEKEKLRRMQEMPRFRPADQIDISEK